MGGRGGGSYKVLGLNFPLINKPRGLSEPHQPATELICPRGDCRGEVIPPWSWTITCILCSQTHKYTHTDWSFTVVMGHVKFFGNPQLYHQFLARQCCLFWTPWSHIICLLDSLLCPAVDTLMIPHNHCSQHKFAQAIAGMRSEVPWRLCFKGIDS